MLDGTDLVGIDFKIVAPNLDALVSTFHNLERRIDGNLLVDRSQVLLQLGLVLYNTSIFVPVSCNCIDSSKNFYNKLEK